MDQEKPGKVERKERCREPNFKIYFAFTYGFEKEMMWIVGQDTLEGKWSYVKHKSVFPLKWFFSTIPSVYLWNQLIWGKVSYPCLSSQISALSWSEMFPWAWIVIVNLWNQLVQGDFPNVHSFESKPYTVISFVHMFARFQSYRRHTLDYICCKTLWISTLNRGILLPSLHYGFRFSV